MGLLNILFIRRIFHLGKRPQTGYHEDLPNFRYKKYRGTFMKRGRPKGRSRDKRSFGPLGDLIRTHRLARGLGLAEVAKACSCSVQFVSNIEHGRAPLPWEKVDQLAVVLKVGVADLQAANLAIRSDFKSFVGSGSSKTKKGTGNASAVAFAAKDPILQEIISKYQIAGTESRKKFARAALTLLA
jgi:transcriptional regulator with XRE-family HTH domain